MVNAKLTGEVKIAKPDANLGYHLTAITEKLCVVRPEQGKVNVVEIEQSTKAFIVDVITRKYQNVHHRVPCLKRIV